MPRSQELPPQETKAKIAALVERGQRNKTVAEKILAAYQLQRPTSLDREVQYPERLDNRRVDLKPDLNDAVIVAWRGTLKLALVPSGHWVIQAGSTLEILSEASQTPPEVLIQFGQIKDPHFLLAKDHHEILGQLEELRAQLHIAMIDTLNALNEDNKLLNLKSPAP